MPRRARLDATGALQHIIGRGIEDPCSKLRGIFDSKECGLFYDSLAFAVQRCRIYRDVSDRQDFLSRLWANVDDLALMLC